MNSLRKCLGRTFGVAAAAVVCSGLSAIAGTVTFQPSAPAPGGADIYNFTAAATDAENILAGDDAGTYVAFDRGAQGQTFQTGADVGYALTAVWLQWVNYEGTWVYLPPGGQFQVRVTDPSASGGAGFVLDSELFPTTGSEPDSLPTAWGGAAVAGAGTWIRFAFDEPVLLAAGTTYGFDVSSPGTAAGFGGFGVQPFFESAGTATDVFAGGAAYSSGANGTGGDDILTGRDGDRAFLLELTVVPEPGVLSLLFGGSICLLAFRHARRS